MKPTTNCCNTFLHTTLSSRGREWRCWLLSVAWLVGVPSASWAAPEETLTEVAPGTVVQVRSVNGRITVEAWDRPLVKVVAERRAKRSADLGKVQVLVRPDGDRLMIEAEFGPETLVNTVTTVDLAITVPLTTKGLTIKSVNSDVEITGFAGPADVEVSNGDVTRDRVAASSRLRTVNGNINAGIVALAAADRVDLQVTNGSCDVKVDPALDAIVSARSSTGRVENRLSAPKLTDSKRHQVVRLGAGAATVDVETTNGDVTIAPLSHRRPDEGESARPESRR